MGRAIRWYALFLPDNGFTNLGLIVVFQIPGRYQYQAAQSSPVKYSGVGFRSWKLTWCPKLSFLSAAIWIVLFPNIANLKKARQAQKCLKDAPPTLAEFVFSQVICRLCVVVRTKQLTPVLRTFWIKNLDFKSFESKLTQSPGSGFMSLTCISIICLPTLHCKFEESTVIDMIWIFSAKPWKNQPLFGFWTSSMRAVMLSVSSGSPQACEHSDLRLWI